MRARGVVTLTLALGACGAPGASLAPRSVSILVQQRSEGAPSAEPSSDEAPPADMVAAPPHPAIGGVFAPYWNPEARRTALPEALCRELTDFREPGLESCDLVALANRTAPCVVVAYNCGAHLCDVLIAVWHGQQEQPFELREAGVTVELSPDHRSLLVGQLVYTDDPELGVSSPRAAQTERIDLASGRREHFADCLSAVLSPKGRYYVCRDLLGNVLRFPVSGGALEMLVRAEVPEDTPVKVGGSFEDFPDPVEFPTPSTLRYRLYLTSEEILEREAPFTE